MVHPVDAYFGKKRDIADPCFRLQPQKAARLDFPSTAAFKRSFYEKQPAAGNVWCQLLTTDLNKKSEDPIF